MSRSLAILVAAGTIAAFDLPTVAVAERPAVEPIAKFATNDWPWWRGPNRNGIADADQTPPRSWSESENIAWKTPIPGRGHGSVMVVESDAFVTFADHETESQGVICLDRKSGKQKWSAEVHKGGLSKKGNKKASLASTSVACDGKRLFVNFFNSGAIYTTALTRDGKQIWQTRITDYTIHQGYGASPAVYDDLVIVSADNKSGKGAIAGLDRGTGEIVWKNSRPKTPNYASPVIVNVADKDQLVFTGCDLVSSFDPRSGETLWEIEGSTTECVTSTVTDGVRIFTSGGYPKNHVSAVRADGSGKVDWSKNVRVYVPSMIADAGKLYAVTDAGVAMCWDSATGEEVWKGRLGGTFSSSPVKVGDVMYATNEAGKTYVYSIAEGFKSLETNQLGDEVFATPTICGSAIFLRIAERKDGKRVESVVCITN